MAMLVFHEKHHTLVGGAKYMTDHDCQIVEQMLSDLSKKTSNKVALLQCFETYLIGAVYYQWSLLMCPTVYGTKLESMPADVLNEWHTSQRYLYENTYLCEY